MERDPLRPCQPLDEDAAYDRAAQDELDDRREGIPPDEEPSYDDTILCCPECETPNQFGEVCLRCQRELQEDMDLLGD